MADRSRVERLNDDVDLRMVGLFEYFEHFEDDTDRDMALRIARAAYAQGYYDAFFEPRAGSLYTDNGYDTPGRDHAEARRER